MEPSDSLTVRCPSCGGENSAGKSRCFLCGQALAPALSGPDNPWAAPASELSPSPYTFTLGSLMLVIALIAVCAGVLVEIPGLGVVLILVSTPALIRTLVAVSSRKRAGKPLLWWEKLTEFVGSLVVVAMIGIGTLIAFTATCFPIGLAAAGSDISSGIFIGICAGAVVAIVAAIFLIRRLWPQRAQ